MKFFTWLNVVFIIIQHCAAAKKRGGKPRIGIVGGGASGLYLAHELLYSYNMDDITIFEKGETASASAVSIEYDAINQYAFDMGTIFIPSSSYKILNDDPNNYEIDFNMWQPFRTLIDKYDLELEARSGAYILDTYTRTIATLERAFIYAGYDISDPQIQVQMVDELIRVINYLEPLYKLQLFDVKDIYDLGIANKGETMAEWGQRLNFEIVTYLQMWAADSAGMGPSVNSSAAFVLKLTEKFRMPYFTQLLTAFGITHESEIIADFPFIKALLYNDGENVSEKPTYYIIKTGYQSLWDNIVNDITLNSKNKIKILFNTAVTNVARSKSSTVVTIATSNEQYKFDYVFITCRRDCIIDILEGNSYPIQYNLYKNYASETFDYYAAAYHLRNKNQWISVDGIYPIYPYAKYTGTNEIDNIYNCEPFYAYVFDNASYFVPFGLSGENNNNNIDKCMDNSFDLLADQQIGIGLALEDFTKDDLIQEEIWNLGSQILPKGEQNGMYEQLYDLQGYHGLFFIGETISGFAVPNQFEFILKHKEQWMQIMNTKHRLMAGKSGENIFISNYESDSTSWYYKAVLSGASDGADVSKFEIQLINANWFVCDKAMWSNYIVFQCSTSASISLPFSVRLTSTDGNVVTSTNVVNSFRAGHVFDFGQNFYSY